MKALKLLPLMTSSSGGTMAPMVPSFGMPFIRMIYQRSAVPDLPIACFLVDRHRHYFIRGNILLTIQGNALHRGCCITWRHFQPLPPIGICRSIPAEELPLWWCDHWLAPFAATSPLFSNSPLSIQAAAAADQPCTIESITWRHYQPLKGAYLY